VDDLLAALTITEGYFTIVGGFVQLRGYLALARRRLAEHDAPNPGWESDDPATTSG
jgi:hypothetical protein